MTKGWCHQLLALVRAAYDTAKGEPPLLGGSKDHKRLVLTGCRYSLWSYDDKRLVPTSFSIRCGVRMTSDWCPGCWHSFRRLAPLLRGVPFLTRREQG